MYGGDKIRTIPAGAGLWERGPASWDFFFSGFWVSSFILPSSSSLSLSYTTLERKGRGIKIQTNIPTLDSLPRPPRVTWRRRVWQFRDPFFLFPSGSVGRSFFLFLSFRFLRKLYNTNYITPPRINGKKEEKKGRKEKELSGEEK